MYSTAINDGQVTDTEVWQLDILLEQVLLLSMQLGDTFIVTNADELWVLDSTRYFAPKVLPLLAQLQVVSARRQFEHRFPGDVFAWKRESFKTVLRPHLDQCSSFLNLVALGDSPAELMAARLTTNGLSEKAVKTVKFKEQPSAADILDQLSIIYQDLPLIVSELESSTRDLSLRLAHQPSPKTVGGDNHHRAIAQPTSPISFLTDAPRSAQMLCVSP